jgi:glycosyltransferase involved in cell wall biosynthesis
MNLWQHLRAAGPLRATIAEIAPALVHVHTAAAAVTAAIARLRSMCPVIGTIHGINSFQSRGFRRRMILLAERWAFAKLQTTYLVNRADEAYVREMRFPGSYVRYRSLALGCDLSRFKPVHQMEAAAEKERARALLRLSPNDFVFAFVGRQVGFKGFANVIRAFTALAAEHEDVKLLLIGTRDHLHPSGLSSAEHEALRRNPAVRAVGWRDDVESLLAITDVNVFPSEREGLPVNVMESLAMGVPVITIQSRGCEELVRDGVDGRVIPGIRWVKDLSTSCLTFEMKAFYRDREKLRRYSANALMRRAEFDRCHWIDEQIKIYDQLVAQGVEPRTES